MPHCFEITSSNLSLAYDHDPRVFGKPQWRCFPHWLFVIYRVVVASYFTGTLVVFMAMSFTQGFGSDFFFFLTNWGFMFLTCYLVVVATATLYNYHISPERPDVVADTSFPNERTPLTGSRPPRQQYTPWYFKLSWFLFNISAVSALIITLVYWPALSSLDTDIPFALDFNVHGLNSIIIIIELVIASMPIRILHVVYVVIIGILYLILTVILYYSGWKNPFDNKPYVYPFLDYSENPWLAALSIILIMIGIIFLQLILWLIFKAKQRIAGPTPYYTDADGS
ncbi:protein rolling stone-like [Glandiceps talaboti]